MFPHSSQQHQPLGIQGDPTPLQPLAELVLENPRRSRCSPSDPGRISPWLPKDTVLRVQVSQQAKEVAPCGYEEAGKKEKGEIFAFYGQAGSGLAPEIQDQGDGRADSPPPSCSGSCSYPTSSTWHCILAPSCWIIGINWLLPTLAQCSPRNLPECPDYQPQFGASSSFIILRQHFPGTGKGELN